MKTSPLLLAALLACSSGDRAPEPTATPASAPTPTTATAPSATKAVSPPVAAPAAALARDILAHDAVACTADGRRCVTTFFERDGEGGARQSYQVVVPGAVERTQLVYDFFASFPDDHDAAVAAAIDAALPTLTALLRDGGFVAVPHLAADLHGDLAIAQGTLSLAAREGSLVDLTTAGTSRSVLPVEPLGSWSFASAAQPPGTSMALLRVGYTLRGVDNSPTAEVAYLVDLDPRAVLSRVLTDGAIACSNKPARCVARRERTGDGGGIELAYQVLTPGKTLRDQPVCDGDMAACDADDERDAAIDRAVDALLADATAGAGELAELTPTRAIDDTVTLPAGTVTIKGGTLRVGTRTLDRVPANTQLLSVVAPSKSKWLVATLEIPPGEGRAGNLIVARMYATR